MYIRHFISQRTLTLAQSVFFIFFAFTSVNCWAVWTNTPGILHADGTLECIHSEDQPVNIEENAEVVWRCPLQVGDNNGVEKTGLYAMYILMKRNGVNAWYAGGNQIIEAGKQLNKQDITWNALDKTFYQGNAQALCIALSDDYGMRSLNNTPQSCVSSDIKPLPPGPQPLLCTFNNGNPFEVSLGDVVRSDLGPLSGTLPGIEKKLDVSCSGDDPSATYSIKFQYTPVDVGGDELITSSANGMAIAMSLNGTLVNSTSSYTRTYGPGTQTETLSFEPVRETGVKTSDILTGAFTASAVMVITIQ